MFLGVLLRSCSGNILRICDGLAGSSPHLGLELHAIKSSRFELLSRLHREGVIRLMLSLPWRCQTYELLDVEAWRAAPTVTKRHKPKVEGTLETKTPRYISMLITIAAAQPSQYPGQSPKRLNA